MKVEVEMTSEQWWVLSTEAEARHCNVADVIIEVANRTKVGREARQHSITVLHAQGMCDADIATRLSTTSTSVARMRRALGLEANKRRWK